MKKYIVRTRGNIPFAMKYDFVRNVLSMGGSGRVVETIVHIIKNMLGRDVPEPTRPGRVKYRYSLKVDAGTFVEFKRELEERGVILSEVHSLGRLMR